MFSPPPPAVGEQILPAYVRASGGVRLRFAYAGARTQRLEVAESGGYRARFPTSYDETCEAVLINTGGGMAGGDAMSVEAMLDPGSHAVVTTQAAEKIYRSQGAATRIVTTLKVGAGATLFWLPQESILFSGSRLSREITVDLAADARLVACESVFFGRAAMGETMVGGAIADRWRVRRDGRLVFADDVRLDGAVATTLSRCAVGAGARAVATVLVFGPDVARQLETLRAMFADDSACAGVEAGAGIVLQGLVVRLLSRDAQALRRVLVTVLLHVTGRALPRTWAM